MTPTSGPPIDPPGGGADDMSDTEIRDLLARLSDVELVQRLRDEHCSGPAWDLVRRQLAQVAIGTLHTIIMNGELRARTSRLGRLVVLTPDEDRELRTDHDERSAIVDDAVAAGLVLVQKEGILAGGWSPARASLRTYSVNACLSQVSGSLRSWRRRRPDREISVGDGYDVEELAVRSGRAFRDDDPRFVGAVDERMDEPAISIEDVLNLLPESVSPWMREAIRLRLRTGSPWALIAPEVGVTSKALERSLRRLRAGVTVRDGGPVTGDGVGDEIGPAEQADESVRSPADRDYEGFARRAAERLDTTDGLAEALGVAAYRQFTHRVSSRLNTTAGLAAIIAARREQRRDSSGEEDRDPGGPG